MERGEGGEEEEKGWREPHVLAERERQDGERGG